MGRIIPYIMENKKCLKPPTSLSFNGRMHQTSILLADKKIPCKQVIFWPAESAFPNWNLSSPPSRPGIYVMGVQPLPKSFLTTKNRIYFREKKYHLFFWRSPFGEMKTYSNSSQSFNSGVYSGLQVSVAFNTISWSNYLDDSGLSPWLRQPPYKSNVGSW